jgi:hypothetical protein
MQSGFASEGGPIMADRILNAIRCEVGVILSSDEA